MRTSLPALATALALPLAACSSAGADAPPASASATTPAAVEPSIDTMKRLVQELSSDAYEGRAPGSAGEEKTLALLAAEFGKLGLKPGNKGSWFQDVPLVEITAKNVSPLSFTGGKNPVSTTYGPEMVIGTYRTTQPKIAVKDSPVVFVGYGINAPEKGWNDYAGVDVKGKTVIILVNDPDYETPGLTGPFNGRAMTYYGRWTYKYEEAARQGAAAALIVHDTVPAAYGWGVVESSWTGPQFFAQSADKGASQTQANGWIQKSAAEKLFASAGKDFAALSQAAKAKGFKPVPLGLKASVSFTNTIDTTMSNNIIGILPGAKRPDEYVLYTAHWDHLGRCKPAPDGDDICNGAVDNATGTAALVALAEAFAKAGAPDRSVVFLAVTAEESGLLGSAYYGENPVYPLAQTVGGINMDAFLMAGPSRNVTVVGKGKSELEDYLNAALTSVDRVASADSSPQNGYYYRSDHFSLAKQGVPMLYIDGGEDLIEGGTAAGAAAAKDYTVNRYHGPKD
ncbi:MAG: M28 family peptidase, partial [Alphaproteobacteria bacterium]|nr:M28 family peptidase [Alphaproteobacteria bacterium]